MAQSEYTAVQTSYDYENYTPPDSTYKALSVFTSAYKNIRFAAPPIRQYVVTDADVAALPTIALREYGDASLWRMLLAYNGLVDGIQDITVGTTLLLPAKTKILSKLSQNSAQQNLLNNAFFI